MSWWIHQKTKIGRQYIWLIDADLFPLLFICGFVVAVIAPSLLRYPTTFAEYSIGLMVTGFVCIGIAKMSLFRRGIWVSWGSSPMTGGYIKLYKIGYTLIGCGIALLFFWKAFLRN